MINFTDISQENNPKIDIQRITISNDAPSEEISITPNKIDIVEPEPESEGCIQDECKLQIGCPTEYFSVKNLFSELTDDYQRAIIRQNLGITDNSAAVWGKIEGNLINQKDLANFIQKTLQNDSEGLLEKVNLELKYWSRQIENKIESLASNITELSIIPRYGIVTDIPIDVLVTWEYDQPVQAQAINGISLDAEVRSYIFHNITDTQNIRLSYYYNNTWLSRNTSFVIEYPTYFGTSNDYLQDQHTINNKFNVNAQENEYIYVLSKNPVDLSVNGLIGGFEQEGYSYISETRYYVYKSVQPNLGNTTIRIHDSE